MKGSEVSNAEAIYLNSKIRSYRKELLCDRTLFTFCGNKYILKQDLVFETPSSAGNFITGSSISGRDYFKDSKGKSINDIFGSHKQQFGTSKVNSRKKEKNERKN